MSFEAHLLLTEERMMFTAFVQDCDIFDFMIYDSNTDHAKLIEWSNDCIESHVETTALISVTKLVIKGNDRVGATPLHPGDVLVKKDGTIYKSDLSTLAGYKKVYRVDLSDENTLINYLNNKYASAPEDIEDPLYVNLRDKSTSESLQILNKMVDTLSVNKASELIIERLAMTLAPTDYLDMHILDTLARDSKISAVHMRQAMILLLFSGNIELGYNAGTENPTIRLRPRVTKEKSKDKVSSKTRNK